ncbi:MAG: glycosyltransferase family 4 protein [Romboutsia timonensis]|uniref:glycosyltransferase family 4 protein n=1 Tax=Romboutsia timonensis TaxID=1776391 RepID=UPI002A7482DB|nr:glycosyltransferase family 4 protein [Romboutsia timonensis]MDY3002443.1 glycosyltransferase family 4 protein [Romboutsia timonensis]
MKKILYVTTVSSTINAFLVPHINMLLERGNIVDCACFINRDIDKTLIEKGVKVFNIPFTRNPLQLQNLKGFNELVKIQKENNYDIIHVHTPVASVYGRLLKIKFPKLKTIYTVHGFHFHKTASKLNWMIYYPIEKFMSRFTDTMITINKEDYERASKFNIDKVYKHNGVGVDLQEYNPNRYSKSDVRSKLNLKDEDFVVLMIAEVNKNKNHRQIIDAVKILKNRNVDIKVLCAGDGNLFRSIRDEVEKANLSENIRMLGYRTDIDELVTSCDVGALMSYREGLPKNIMELMAARKTVVGTNIRGICDLVVDGYNGYLVEVGDSKATADKLEYLKNNRKKLDELSDNAYEFIRDYNIDKVVEQLSCVY